jgi:hypothetical protein
MSTGVAVFLLLGGKHAVEGFCEGYGLAALLAIVLPIVLFPVMLLVNGVTAVRDAWLDFEDEHPKLQRWLDRWPRWFPAIGAGLLLVAYLLGGLR